MSIERLYIHIPFCQKICSFCNLYARQDKGEQQQNDYLNKLEQELIFKKKYLTPLKSLYIGGGTPSQLTYKNLHRLIQLIKKNTKFQSNYEFTFEAHPESLNKDKIQLLFDNYLTRLSIGVESLTPTTKLERHTSPQQLDNIFNILANYNFQNINLDLIYNSPEQTLEQWQQTLNTILTYPTNHLSAYSLILENSKLTNQYNPDSLEQDLSIAMWKATNKTLAQANYHQYEVSNYAKQDYHCQHNLATWQGENFLGIGSGATSIIDNTHIANSKSLQWLTEKVQISKLTPYQRACEILAFNFRHTQGISIKKLQNLNGINILKTHQKTLNELIRIGWLENKKTSYYPTEEGLLFADSIASYFI